MVVVDIKANATLYEQALQRLSQLQDQFEGKLRGVGETSKKISREERELNRARAQILQQLMTPQDRYNEKVGQLDRLLKANKLSQDQYTQAVRQAKTEMDGAGKSAEGAFGQKTLGMVTGLAGALGITGGVAGAVQLVRMEYQHLIDVQREAAAITMTTAQAQEAALTNLGATMAGERDRFVFEVGAMSKTLGVSESEIYKRASDALSARGDKPIYGRGGAMEAVEASFGFAPGDTAAGIAASGAALDISAITGGTAEQSLGFLQAVGQRARVTDPRKLAVNLPPALTSATAAGADPQTAGALYAALTQGMTDPMGESSRTATIALSQQLSEFQPITGGGKWKTMTMHERIQRLRADKQLRSDFLEKASFEKRAQAPIEQLLAGGNVARAYEQFRTDLPGVEASGVLFNEATAVKRGAAAQQVAASSRSLTAIEERAAMADMARGGTGTVEEKVWKVMGQAGIGATEQLMDWVRTKNTMEGFEDLARGKAAEFGPGGYRRPDGEKAAMETSKVLLELADTIGDLRKAAEAQARSAEAQARAADKLDRNAGGGPTLRNPNSD